MLKSIYKLSLLFVSLPLALNSHAIERLSDDQLSNATGQADALIDLDLRLNVDENNQFVCEGNTTFCRLAFSVNNGTDSAGNQTWLVAKGLRGAIKIEGLRLGGATDIGGTGNNGIKLTFDNTKPIQIRNLGFDALSFESDFTPTGLLGNGYAEENASGKGYLAPGYYGNFNSSEDPNGVSGYSNSAFYNVQAFDQGREIGFLGLEINGNLAVDGSITIFNFTPTP